MWDDKIGEEMVICAFRYCLGRRTYVVRDCAMWLMAGWDDLSERTRVLIDRELVDAINHDNESRNCENTFDSFHPLGDDCDRDEWKNLQRFIDDFNNGELL